MILDAVKLGVELNSHQVAGNQEVAEFQNLSAVFVQKFIGFNEFLWAVKCAGR